MTTRENRMTPESRLDELIAHYVAARNQQWEIGRFSAIKPLTPTEKGNIAEDFVEWLGQRMGLPTERPESRRGEWDVSIGGTAIEVKVATLDVHGMFQFNGIRRDYNYDLLVVVGIAPSDVWLNVYAKDDLDGLTLVPMQRNTNATFKLTRSPDDLEHPSRFAELFREKRNR